MKIILDLPDEVAFSIEGGVYVINIDGAAPDPDAERKRREAYRRWKLLHPDFDDSCPF